MNKKFFSALMFGALVTASTGTFVSCTDYDDDIDNLQEQINGLKDLSSRVSALESSVASAQSAATGAQSAADAAKAAAANAQSSADAAKAAADAAQATANDLKARVEALEAGGDNSAIEAAKAAAEGAQRTADAAKQAAQEAKDAAAAAQQTADSIKDEVAQLKADVAALKDAINGAGSGSGSGEPGYDDSSLVKKISALETRVSALIGTSIVSSIVFDGTLYMDGIESQEYMYFMYQPIKPIAKNAGPFKAWDGDKKKDANVQTFEGTENKSIYNGYDANYLWEANAEWVGAMIRNEKVVNEVNYLVNPASAKVQLKNLAMYGKDVTLVTRATSGVDYNVDVTNSVNAWDETIIDAKGHQARLITVPYTAAGAHETGIEDSEYNGNSYYNALKAALATKIETPGAKAFAGVDYTGKFYCHDLEENGNADYDNGTNASDEGKSNLFQLVANFQDGSAPSVESDYAMLYASPVTPQAIAFTGETVDNHKVSGSQASQASGAIQAGKVVSVAECNQATKDLHLYRTMQEAIENAPNFEVGYYKDQVDLKKYLEVHYNRYSKIKANNHKHASWAYDEIGRYGLVWNYELVDWNHGSSGVADTYAHQSQFANPTAAKNGILIPCKINADGTTNTAATTKADYAIIGKEPIIKVTVTDSNNGNAVVLIGFVKFKIVERLGVHDMGVIHTFDHTIECGNFVTAKTANTAWNEYQYNVLQEAVGLSYVEFCSLYKLDVNGSNNAIQFKKTGTLNQDGQPEFEEIGTDNVLIKCPRLAGTVGIIKEIKNVAGVGNNDNGLQWQLSPCELRDIYLNRNGVDSTYVRYVRTDDTHSSKDPVYVAVKIKVGYEYPTVGSISDKLDEYWFQNEVNGTSLVSKPGNKAGNDESKMDGVRANVWEPTNGQQVTDLKFDYSLTSAWTTNEIEFTDAVSPASIPGAKPYEYFYFHPATNHVKVGYYDLRVESTAIDVDDLACTSVHADCSTGTTPVCPATVSVGANAQEAIANVYQAAYDYYSKPSDGTLYQNDVVKIYFNGVYQDDLCTLDKKTGKIHYENNTTAKQILNMFSHNAAEAYVYVGVYGLNEECPQYVDPMQGYTYTVHFLRPIECNEGNEKNLKDAHDNGDKFFAYDLFNDFQDWRNVQFVPNNVWYFYYYNVKSITLDIANATTTLNGSNWKRLGDITTEVILEHWDATSSNKWSDVYGSSPMPITYGEGDWADGSNADQATLASYMREKFGYIVYHNNMGNVDSFKVRIPVVLEYDWGMLNAFTVTINIDYTTGN